MPNSWDSFCYLFEVNVSPFRSFKEVLRGDFLQTRVFGAQNQSDCRNAEKAIEQCWQYGGVVSCRGVCRLKMMQFLTQMTTGWEDF